MARPVRSSVFGRETIWKSRSLPFRLDELRVEHQLADGRTLCKNYISFERVDAVAALVVNRDTRSVILVDQFRGPVAEKGVKDGILTEAPAGMVEQGESAVQALRREIAEETGYLVDFDVATGKLRDSELIADYFPSPGGSSERIILYYVPVDSATPLMPDRVKRGDSEFVQANTVALADFFKELDEGRLRDSKAIIAGLWLKQKIDKSPITWRLKTDPGHREYFSIRDLPRRRIGYFCGDIANAHDINVWVNSENTNFQMDQFGGRSMSARVRTLGASFDANDNLIEDSVQDAIKSKLAIGAGVELGQVIDTPAGRLGKPPFNVGCLIHASVVSYELDNHGVRRPVSTIIISKNCFANALALFDRLGAPFLGNPFTSMIVPLLGTGQAGVDHEQCVTAYVDMAIRYLTENPQSKLERLYLLAYSAREIEICDRVMSRHPALARAQPK